MALSTPLLYPIPAFDATLENAINFTVLGGDQVVGNRISIKINSSQVEVYNEAVESYVFSHTIPANTLTNGVYYVAQIKTYGNASDISDPTKGSPWSTSVPFYCYSTPVVSWANQPLGSIIDTSTFTFIFSYSQAENEQLYSYIINLYDQSQTLISTSGTKYISTSIPSITYTVNGLLNNNSYYIEMNGETVNNTQITTEKIAFTVSYYEPYSKQGFTATNDACNGWITLVNNVVIIASSSYPDPPIYLYGDTAVDIRQQNYYVKWSGINQNDDFCIRIWGYDFNSNETIFNYMQTDIAYNIQLIRRDGYDYGSDVLQTYYELQVQINDNQPLFIYSNYINQPESTDEVFICIKRINNIYGLYIENLGE